MFFSRFLFTDFTLALRAGIYLFGVSALCGYRTPHNRACVWNRQIIAHPPIKTWVQNTAYDLTRPASPQTAPRTMPHGKKRRLNCAHECINITIVTRSKILAGQRGNENAGAIRQAAARENPATSGDEIHKALQAQGTDAANYEGPQRSSHCPPCSRRATRSRLFSTSAIAGS